MRLVDLISPKQSFRPDEAARILGFCCRTVYRMIRDGRLPSVRLGQGSWRVPRQSLLNFLMAPPE